MTYKISFGHLEVGARARSLVNRALDNNWVSAGENVELLENLFKKTFGVKHAVAVSSGTDAVLAGLLALKERHHLHTGLTVPALCFPAPVNAALAAGIKPIFVDIDRKTLNVKWNPYDEGEGGALLVHTMGRPCLIEAKKADYLRENVVEDCCEAHGATLNGKMVGTQSFASAFSFYAAHLICSGEGGMVCTQDDKTADLLKSVRSHGRPPDSIYFDFQRFGLNLKMNDLEAAIGIEGVENFPKVFAKRRELLMAFRKGLSKFRGYFYTFEQDPPGCVTAPHAIPLVVREDAPFQRDALYQRLEQRSIQCKTLFGSLPTQHKAFAAFGHRLGEFPEAEFVGANGLHFGCHQYLTLKDVDYVVGVIEEFVKEYTKSDL